jgi:hypothetical protein
MQLSAEPLDVVYEFFGGDGVDLEGLLDQPVEKFAA